MSEINDLLKEISISRRELKNIRQDVLKNQSQFQSQFNNLMELLSPKDEIKDLKESLEETDDLDHEKMNLLLKPIGVISSCFKNKNGIPRQPFLCEEAKAVLEISKEHFTNPEHSLLGLEDFSHVWVLFYFHKNGPQNTVKAKVHPPRLDGATVGVFSTRSPHRPCPIGLSLVKLEKISDNRLYLSGVDLLNGTPVLDIKPYIESYDTPPDYRNQEKRVQNYETEPGNICEHEIVNTHQDALVTIEVSQDSLASDSSVKGTHVKKAIDLIKEPPSGLNVIFTPRAESDIENFHPCQDSCRCKYCLDFLGDAAKAKTAVIQVLKSDPRSVYRRNKCSDRLYYFNIDKMHVTTWFDEENIAEVLRVKPIEGRVLPTI